jgi:hypothetical protein
MQEQSQINEVISRPESIDYIQKYLESHPKLNRMGLSAHLCDHFSFFDVLGRRQTQTTLHSLRQLESTGAVTLPESRRGKRTGIRKPSRLPGGLPELKNVPVDLENIKGLKLVLVECPEQICIWNELMIRDHPNGYGPLVGRQVRYLIESEDGVLGGFGFSASAITLKDRDEWMCWSPATRRKHLDKVVGMSRFLIRSEVSCPNLGSKLLSMAAKQLPQDFFIRYGYRPLLLESFVDCSAFTGGVYRASNWTRIGQTQGRGRADRDHTASQSKKDIYVYVLDQKFRKKLQLDEPPKPLSLSPTEGLDIDEWAQREFSTDALGDARLSKRLVSIAALKAAYPGQSLLELAKGNRSEVKAYYRLIASPDDSDVTFENMLSAHRQQTIARMRSQEVVLAIQDTSDLNFNGLNACSGLGINSKNTSNSSGSKGLKLHSTFVVSEDGLPLGVLRSDCYARKSVPTRTNDQRRELPITEKETYRWFQGLEDCAAVAKELDDTQLICVADREADIFELFEYQREHREVELLIRAAHERSSKRRDYVSLFEQLRASDLKATFTVEVPTQSARSGKSTPSASEGTVARTAKMQLRYKSIKLPPPDSTLHRRKDPINLSMVHLVEVNPPEGVTAIEWFLITTLPINSDEDALKCVKWYRSRWRIEEWHRVLKSGCKIGKVKNRTAGNIKRAIAVDLVIAWRIMLMCLLGREVPGLPAEIIFSSVELEVLEAYASKKKLTTPRTIFDAINLVASIGGYCKAGKTPRPPGFEIYWRGYRTLQTMCEAYRLFMG